MKKTLPIVLFHVFSMFSFAQNTVTGLVADSAGKPAPYIALGLCHAHDTSLVKGNVSDSSGRFYFEKIKPGSYRVKINAIGFKPLVTDSFRVDSTSEVFLPAMLLIPEGVQLSEIAVSVYRPGIEFKKGMVIMNVENDLLAKGNTVLELLKRIPGVVVDAQNNITINGVGGARFLIDDRLQQMPAVQVIDMLSGMSAESVTKIELIRNPPARYDAAGSGGLINIVTKKARLKGYSGSASFGISQGKRLRFGPSFSFNYKANKLSLFTNASYGKWKGLNEARLDRTFTGGTANETVNTAGSAESFQKVFSGNGGIEYDLTKKTLIGFYINGNRNNDSYSTRAETAVSGTETFNYNQMSYSTEEHYRSISPAYNLSVLHKLDTTGGQLKVSADLNTYTEQHDKNNLSRFFNNNDVEIAAPSNYKNTSYRNYKVFSQKADLNKTFRNKLSIESGIKAGFIDNINDNELRFSNQSTGLFIGDTVFYNNYRYRERVLAAYTTLEKTWDKINLSLGVRAEETSIRAADRKTAYRFARNYYNIFPSGSIDYTLNKKNTVSAAYSYRIDRPHYGMLNPVRMISDQLNYGAGNPELRPQFTHEMSIYHNYNQFITQTIGLNKTKDFTFWYSYIPPGTRMNVDTISNIRASDNLFYSVSAQNRIKWYNFQTYAVVIYRTFSGDLRNEDVSSSTVQFYMNLNQEFFLPKDFKIQIWAGRGSGFQDGPQYYYARSAIYVSLSKSFLDKKLNVTLGLSDILYRDYLSYASSFSGQDLYWIDKADTRRVRFTINYRFGKMRVEQRLNAEGDTRMKTGK